MKKHSDRVMHSSAFPDWGTPSDLVFALESEFGRILLDAAASCANTKGSTYYGLDHDDEKRRDGLARSWYDDAEQLAPMVVLCRGREVVTRALPPIVFVNPPYSREHGIQIGPWVEKSYEESLKGALVLGVLPQSSQTKWWQKWVRRAHEIRDVPHRVDFEASPSTLAAMNEKRAKEGKPAIEEAWNAGNNTSVVIWKPNPGYVGHVEPVRRFWTYRQNYKAAA